MKIHRSEKETFIALSILALFLIFFEFFSIFGQKVMIFVKKYLFSLFSLRESLKNSSYLPSFFHRKFIAFIAMILKFPSLHRSEKKVQ